MALVTPEEDAPATPDASVVAEVNANLAQDIADASNVVVAADDAEFDFAEPEIEVSEDPEPVVVAPRRTTSTNTGTSSSGSSSGSATKVAQSSAVKAAISGSAVIAEASKYVGVPYVSGGSSPSGFDCSGFVSYVYGKLGVSLPRTSGAYYNVGTRVSSPQPGDIIVSPGHLGIYAGPNLQIDAPRPGKTIQFRSIWQSNPVYVRVTG